MKKVLSLLLAGLTLGLTQCGSKTPHPPEPPVIIPQYYTHLEWTTPAPAMGTTYVYRGNPDSSKPMGCALTKIAQTNQLTYDDKTVAKGFEYCYALTQHSNLYNTESAFSKVVQVQIP